MADGCDVAANMRCGKRYSVADQLWINGKLLADLSDAIAAMPGGGGGVADSVSGSAASVASTEATVAVGVASTPVVAASATRVGGWVKNVSDDFIWVSFSGTATTAKPTKLGPGAVLELAGPGWRYTGAVSAIQTTGGTLNLEVVAL